MKRFFGSVWRVIHDAFEPLVLRKQFRRVMVVDELPDSLEFRRVYVVGNGAPWSVAMLCPCGCGEIIQLSLLVNDSPRWKVSYDKKGLPTLSPSIWRTAGCRSHFFMRGGTIVWCK
jgi:Family of unknown function (DUF6527)